MLKLEIMDVLLLEINVINALDAVGMDKFVIKYMNSQLVLIL